MSKKSRFESEIINAFYEFLLKKGLKESTCNDYCRRILAICEQFHITPEDFLAGRGKYSIDDLIGLYSNHPEMKAENAAKHNGPLSALKQFKNFAAASVLPKEETGILLSQEEGDRSFVNFTKHISGIYIQNRYCVITYSENRMVCDRVEKQINDRNYADLIATMCKYQHLLNESQKSVVEIFPYGGAPVYRYAFAGKKSVFGGVWPLFVSEDRTLQEEAHAELHRAIGNIVKQAGGKSLFQRTKAAAFMAEILNDPFWQAFADYLSDEGLAENSIVCYIWQYLRKSFEKYLGMDCRDFSKLDDADKIRTAEDLHAKLAAAKNAGGTDSKKTVQNYSSAVSALLAFLQGSVSAAAAALVSVPAATVIDEYPYQELLRIFKARLITQDREYRGAALPCRLLNKLFSRDPNYKKLIKEVLDNTVFLLGKGRTITLKDIDKVRFAGGNVWVVPKNGTEEELYTEVYQKGKYMGQAKMQATRIRELSLDHDVPLANMFGGLLNSCPNLKKLSDGILAYKATLGGNRQAKSQFTTDFYNTQYRSLGIDEVALLAELSMLYRNISLTIMQLNYNISKNSLNQNNNGQTASTQGSGSNSQQTQGNGNNGQPTQSTQGSSINGQPPQGNGR